MSEHITSLIRYALVFVGSWIVQQGWVDNGAWEQVMGAILTLVGVGWSIYLKVGTARVPVETLTKTQTAVTGIEKP